MSISLQKYVDIQSRFPTLSTTARTLGGLVFTNSSMIEGADVKYKTAFDKGEAVELDLTSVGECFGISTQENPTPEYEFALRYYSYISPTGHIPCALKFAKVLPTGADGALEKPEVSFTRIDETNNAFGSFTFLDTADKQWKSTELKGVATMNGGKDTRYLFVVNHIRGEQTVEEVIQDKSFFFNDVKGTCYISGADAYSAYMPMSIFASTDYEKGDEAPCHMFKQFGYEDPSVKTNSEYEAFKGANINFYGQSQSNGMRLSFYQRGFNTDGTNTAIYCNEVWFKSACESKLIHFFLQSERVPANDEGVALVSATVNTVCSLATNNNSFTAKTVGADSESSIRTLIARCGGTTGEADQVLKGIENVGYYVFAYLDGSGSEYYIHYYVFYGTSDSVRYIKGDDVLVH